MTRPRSRSGCLCNRGRRLFYKPVGAVGRSCLSVGWLLPPRLLPEAFLASNRPAPIPQLFNSVERHFPCGQVNRGGPSRCLGSRAYSGRRVSVATRHGDAFVGTDDAAYDIFLPLESSLGHVNTRSEYHTPQLHSPNHLLSL